MTDTSFQSKLEHVLARLEYTKGLTVISQLINSGYLDKEHGQVGMLYIPITKEEAVKEIMKLIMESITFL